MKLSIYLNTPSPGPEHDREVIESNIDQVLRVTNAGFAGVVLTEHHLSEYNTYCDGLMMAAYLAGRTPPATRFLLAVVVPPLHNPMRLAAQLNLLNVLTDGNAIIGLGTGGAAAIEPAGFGRDPKDRDEDLAAVLDAMKAAMAKRLEDPPLHWSTRYESGTVFARMMPSGTLGPTGRASTSDASTAAAGAAGQYLFTGRLTPDELQARLELYQRGLQQSGLDAAAIEDRLDWSFCQKNIIVRDTDAEARAEAMRCIERHQAFARRLKGYLPTPADDPDAPSKRFVHVATPEDFFARGYVAGSPATVRAELERYLQAGARHLALEFHFGFMTIEESDASIDLFLDEVMPQLPVDRLSAPVPGG